MLDESLDRRQVALKSWKAIEIEYHRWAHLRITGNSPNWHNSLDKNCLNSLELAQGLAS